MSEENVEFVRRAFTEFAGESAQTVIEGIVNAGLAAPDAEFDFSAMYPDGPILRGHEAWRRFIDGLPWGSSMRTCGRRVTGQEVKA